jgi:hypothetical protein
VDQIDTAPARGGGGVDRSVDDAQSPVTKPIEIKADGDRLVALINLSAHSWPAILMQEISYDVDNPGNHYKLQIATNPS